MATRKYQAHIDLQQNELQNAVVQNLSVAPNNPKDGQIYYNTTDNKSYIWNGTSWVETTSQGDYTFTNGVQESSRTVSLKLGTSSNATVTADTNGLAVSVADASNSQKGVIEIADDTEADAGTAETLAVNPKQLATRVKANTAITGATKCKITYDSKGLVTSGADLTSGDIPDLSATYILASTKGQANGVASLDNDGKVPLNQLPSYVDDVVDTYVVSGATALSAGWLSATSGGSALTPETGKIYVVLSDGAYLNKTYRWSGTTYIEISASPAQATESAAGIAEIATQSEVNTGTNDTDFVTPLKLATYVGNKKATASNPALTASGGQVTWTISTTLAPNCIITIRETTGGAEVYADVTYGSGSITVKMNASSNVSAGVYTAVILGQEIANE